MTPPPASSAARSFSGGPRLRSPFFFCVLPRSLFRPFFVLSMWRSRLPHLGPRTTFCRSPPLFFFSIHEFSREGRGRILSVCVGISFLSVGFPFLPVICSSEALGRISRLLCTDVVEVSETGPFPEFYTSRKAAPAILLPRRASFCFAPCPRGFYPAGNDRKNPSPPKSWRVKRTPGQRRVSRMTRSSRRRNARWGTGRPNPYACVRTTAA